jgi:hypothetical protein
VENPKSVVTPFEGGCHFPTPENTDNGTSWWTTLIIEYVATAFSPSLLVYASLHSSGQITLHPILPPSQSSIFIPILAQKLTAAMKRGIIFDDIILVLEPHLTDGTPHLVLTNPDFALKTLMQTMKFTGHQFEVSKTLPMEQIVSHHFWSKVVALQYSLYSRLPGGGQIASNGMLLLQLRSMFMAFMMSVKVDNSPRGQAIPKPQVMGRLWITRADLRVGNADARGFKEAWFNECMSTVDEG